MLGRYHVFVSADKAGRTDEVNAAALDSLKQKIDGRCWEYDEVDGVYNGVKERSLCVQLKTLSEVERLFEIAFYDFDQECVLVVDAHLNAFFLEDGRVMKPSGRMYTSSIAVAGREDYTYNPVTQLYHYLTL